jgi:biopolymer transport protein ExbD
MRSQLFHLRPEFPERPKRSAGLLEVAPWVDVVMLLILLLLSFSIAIRKPGLVVNLPAVPAASGARYDAYVLTVPREGVYYFDDARVSPAILAGRLRAVANSKPDHELIIEADGALSHRALSEIYNLAAAAGWSRIVLATRIDAAPEAAGKARP